MISSMTSYSSPMSLSSSSGTINPLYFPQHPQQLVQHLVSHEPAYYDSPMGIGIPLAMCEVITRRRRMVTDIIRVPSSEHVAQIVGKSGSKIKSLRTATNTCIKTPHRGDEPVFTITGQLDNVQRAKEAIERASSHFSHLMATKASMPQDGEIMIRVPVPKKYIGVVVGRAGTTILKIKEQTNTRINTPRPDNDNPTFEITGSIVNVMAAKEAIVEKVRAAHKLRGFQFFDPNQNVENYYQY